MPKTKKSSANKSKHSLLPVKRSRRTFLLLTIGIILILIPVLFYLNQSIQLMYFVPNVAEVTHLNASSPNPKEIRIPAVQISLPVGEGKIVNKSWEVSSSSVTHLDISANPGENGPIIMYSHNTTDRFGPIRWLNKGNEILVKTADDTTHRYQVIDTKVVNPDELSVFFQRKSETLYLYTCDGFADLKRFIVIAEPIK